jgi:putative flippase GtrA
VSGFTTSTRLSPAQAFLRDIRSSKRGLAGQGVRFAIAGGVVAMIYLSLTTVLHDVFSLPFQLALVLGFTFAVSVHFTLQRVFVWKHNGKFALSIHHQAVRYLGVCFMQYGLTALSTAQLPKLLSLPLELVYVVTALLLAGLNFALFRGGVFHSDELPG